MRSLILIVTTLLGPTIASACAAPPPEIEEPAPFGPNLGPSSSPWDMLPESTSTPPLPTTSAGTSSPSSAGSNSSSTGAGEPVDLSDLRLVEVLADPEGKDGDDWSPEIVEAINLGEEALVISELTILARGWPRLDTPTLELDAEELGPGERLVLYRYSDLDTAPWTGVFHESGVLEVHFETSSGLRNSDGAVLLLGPQDAPIDALIYGGPPPPSHDFEDAWDGEPVDAPISGSSWCRYDPAIDSDSAEDWTLCVPSPGEPNEATETGSTGDGGDSTTGTSGSTSSGDTTDTGVLPADATVVITEVLSNAPGPNALEREYEYVEILNLGPDDIDLDMWTLADSLELDAPGRDPLIYREGDGGCDPQTCLAVGERALLVGGAYLGPSGGALVLETDDTTLADGGLAAHEPVVLRDSDELIASTYRDWVDPYAEPYPINVELPAHRSDPYAEDEPIQWTLGDGSPGQP